MRTSALTAVLIAMCASPAAFAQNYEEPPPTVHVSTTPYSLDDWELTGRVYGGYDDNANFVSDGDPLYDGETGSAVIGIAAQAVYRKALDTNWSAGAILRIDQSLFLDKQDNLDEDVNDNASDYSTFVAIAGGFVEHAWTRNDLRAHVGASYQVTYEDAKIGSIGGVRHAVTLYGEYEPTFHSSLGAELVAANQDFEVDYDFSTPTSQRDSTYLALKLKGRLDFDGRRRSMGAFIKAAKNDADGRRFSYTGVSAGITPTFQINGPVWLYLEASADKRDYETVTFGPPRTEQTIYKAGAQVVWMVDKRWTVDAKLAHMDVQANDPLYEGKRTTFLVGVQARY